MLAGPFDELAISPGEFTNPFEQECHRITRAYASSIAAVVNGTGSNDTLNGLITDGIRRSVKLGSSARTRPVHLYAFSGPPRRHRSPRLSGHLFLTSRVLL